MLYKFAQYNIMPPSFDVCLHGKKLRMQAITKETPLEEHMHHVETKPSVKSMPSIFSHVHKIKTYVCRFLVLLISFGIIVFYLWLRTPTPANAANFVLLCTLSGVVCLKEYFHFFIAVLQLSVLASIAITPEFLDPNRLSVLFLFCAHCCSLYLYLHTERTKISIAIVSLGTASLVVALWASYFLVPVALQQGMDAIALSIVVFVFIFRQA